MKLLQFSRLGTHGNAPRLWLESRRLSSLGFVPGTALDITRPGPDALRIGWADTMTGNRVSTRKAAGRERPIIDVSSAALLGELARFREIKIAGSWGRLDITPTVRSAAIVSALGRSGPLRVIDVFAGGGTLTDAAAADPRFQVVAGVEINPDFADEWQEKHPDADLYLGDLRSMDPAELPAADVICAGIPCTSHSNQGRAKKGLAGRPEMGDTGDLFVPVLQLVAAKMPAAVVLENVPLFGRSLAGAVVIASLRSLGYSIAETVLRAREDWAEPTTRDRWVCVATLRPGFELKVPGVEFNGTVGRYLDAPDANADKADAERIAVSVAGLRRHNERHAAKGHGFALKVIDGTEDRCPVICASYHKVNSSGAMVATPYGPRLLRSGEVARLHGQTVKTPHFATAIAIMGQGVCTRIFRQVFAQLGAHLAP